MQNHLKLLMFTFKPRDFSKSMTDFNRIFEILTDEIWKQRVKLYSLIQH